MHDDHLRLHLQDGKHLREFALREFISAARTGRIIAFVGSYATEDMRYPKWKEFLAKYSELFGNPKSHASGWIDLANEKINPPPLPPGAPLPKPPPTASSKTALVDLVVEHWLANTPDPKKRADSLKKYKARLCGPNFFGLTRLSGRQVTESAPYEIVESLGINRIITTNYDLEFEWQFMVTAEEHAATHSRPATFRRLIEGATIARNCDTGGLSRRLPSGRSTYSDVFDRERTDRLIEFAVGAPDHHGHVLHLHGRATADDKDRLVVGLGDYQQQYRRSGIAKVPFEHALKLLYAGNPVIFVGNGMTEPEVTNTLENFVSDDLRHRLAPAFVLWSPDEEQTQISQIAITAEDELRRIEWYRRFGVLMIYDCELAGFDCPGGIKALGAMPKPRRVAHAVHTLGAYARDNIAQFDWKRTDLRAAQSRFSGTGAPAGTDPLRYDVWRCNSLVEREKPFLNIFKLHEPFKPAARELDKTPKRDRDAFYTLFRGAPVKAIIDRPGWGHGYLAKVIAKAFSDDLPRLGVKIETAASVVNAGFIGEIDSTFALISGLFDGETAFGKEPTAPNDPPLNPMSRQKSLLDYEQKLLVQMKGGQLDRHLLLVINGMDRFFDTSGYPLSNELDNMVRKIAQAYRAKFKYNGVETTIHDWVQATRTVNPYTVILLGSARVQRYLDGLGWVRETDDTIREGKQSDYVILGADDHRDGRAVLNTINERNEAIWTARGETSPFAQAGSTPHSNYLILLEERMKAAGLSASRETLMTRGRSRGIGDLRHSVLAAYLRSDSLRNVFADMKQKGELKGPLPDPDLCLDILSSLAFFGQPIERCVIDVLPRVTTRLAQKPRRRSRVDTAIRALAKLGLILRFPPFTESPRGWHRYGIHRTVMAELRNRYGVPISDAKLSAGFNLSLFASQLIDDYTPKPDIHLELGGLVDELIRQCETACAATPPGDGAARAEPGAYLRAAKLLMRNYFTTSALLMLEPPLQAAEEHKAPLTDHADRLARLLGAAERLAGERGRLRATQALQGAEAFFPDDLVWMQNEVGVVKLVQGDLYKARLAFEAAQTINRDHVEYGDELQNWRRIQLNQLHLDIERGKISSAESRILEIERAVNSHVEMFRLDPAAAASAAEAGAKRGSADYAVAPVQQIIERYGKRTHERTRVVDPDFPADAILTVGLITGYRGLNGYLRGNFKSALEQLDVAITILRNIGEQRGCAIFLRHAASLLGAMGSTEKAAEYRRIGLAAADSVRQMDLAFLYRVDSFGAMFEEGVPEQPVTLRPVTAALDYSVGADMYRIRIEARQALADMRFAAGDYDGALEHAADALAVASRFGFGLRKISLRILIGRVLLSRGDPLSGNALLDQAIISADRVGFQRAVERAQQVRYKYSRLRKI